MDKTPPTLASLSPVHFDINEWLQQDFTQLPVADSSTIGLTAASDELFTNDDLLSISSSSPLISAALELSNQLHPNNTAVMQHDIVTNAQSFQFPSLSEIVDYFDESILTQTETSTDLSLSKAFDNSPIDDPTGNLSLEEQHLIDEARPLTEEGFTEPFVTPPSLNIYPRRAAPKQMPVITQVGTDETFHPLVSFADLSMLALEELEEFSYVAIPPQELNLETTIPPLSTTSTTASKPVLGDILSQAIYMSLAEPNADDDLITLLHTSSVNEVSISDETSSLIAKTTKKTKRIPKEKK